MPSEYFSKDQLKPVLLINKRGRCISIQTEFEAQKLRAVGFKDPLIQSAKVGDYFPQYDQGQSGEFKETVSYSGNFNPKKGDSDILEVIEI